MMAPSPDWQQSGAGIRFGCSAVKMLNGRAAVRDG
jgi:hypothetical protein